MTFQGTNTYLVGCGAVAVIDPGPDLPAHLAAILAALQPGEKISHIFVTHSHLDHSPLAARLAALTGAPVLAFGPSQAGRSDVMQGLAALGMAGGGEGVDQTFTPDICLKDGDVIARGDWEIEALHTPGHMANHLCFAWNGHLFSGDHVMGWASSLVSPPDGDMTQYMTSLRRLRDRPWTGFFPGHGPEIQEAAQRLDDLHSHRLGREAAILAALHQGPSDVVRITGNLYRGLAPMLLPAARRNVLAHLIDLCTREMVAAIPRIGPDAIFKRL
jgi:glyoxylase-like metal-dependent hydrolase (beta-lactamase superfamily II)